MPPSTPHPQYAWHFGHPTPRVPSVGRGRRWSPASPPQDRSPSISIRQPRVVALTVAPPFLRRPGRPPLPYLPYGDEKKVAGRGKEAEERDRSEGKGGRQRGEEEREEGKEGEGSNSLLFLFPPSPNFPFYTGEGFTGWKTEGRKGEEENGLGKRGNGKETGKEKVLEEGRRPIPPRSFPCGLPYPYKDGGAPSKT